MHFFGHRNLYKNIDDLLVKQVFCLIENENIETFYIGQQGEYDSAVLRALKEAKEKYSNIEIVIVLAYLNEKVPEGGFNVYFQT